jgi:hypothetical protein
MSDEQTGIVEEDFADTGHLKMSGQEKSTRWLYSEVFFRYVTKTRDAEIVADWDERAQYWYEHLVQN